MRRLRHHDRPRASSTSSVAPAVALAALLLVSACTQRLVAQDQGQDQAAIRELIAEHYVKAVFVSREEAAVRRAFHPSFHLFVLDDGEIIIAPLQMWLDRLKLDGVPSSSAVRHDVGFVDVSGDAAAVRTELYVNGQHVYTDYFSLYRFPTAGWQIVTKIFQSHD